jgi:hypothetical protein
VSAPALLGLGEMYARSATYPDLARTIRTRFTDPQATCIDAAGEFLLSEAQARAIADRLVQTVVDEFDDAADTVGMTDVARKLLWRRAFLPPYAFEDFGSAPV